MAMRVENNPLEAAYAALLTQGLDGAGEALRILVNEAGKIERAQHLNAQPFERCAERRGYANGFKPKTVMTRLGEQTFDIPQVRDSSFYPSALEKGSRTEQALNIALAEMYVQGVSTRKVITVLQSLLGPEVSISSTQVSRAAETLDAGLQAWRERPLNETPYVFLDARYERVRAAGQIIDCAVLVAVGVTHEGRRRVLGVSVELSEAEVHWRSFLDTLVRRGLCGVKLIVSDHHAGLKAARRAVFPSVPWQRCQFHLQQNAQAYVTRLDQRLPVAQRIRAIFNAPDREEAQRLLNQAIEAWRKDAPKLAEWAEENLPMGFAVFDYPSAHRIRLRTTNGLERINRELLPGLLTGQDGLAKLVESVLNQVLEAQVTESLGAARHERSEERAGYRNGVRPRTLYTRVGPVTLRVPQTRDGSFSTDLFKRYQRSEQAFVLALMEMTVQGVSTRKVSAITEELCGASFSKSTVSQLCTGLDTRVRAFNERSLEGEYPFVLVDALFINSRQQDRVVKRAVLIAYGITASGYREILGVKIGDSESYATWDEMFRWLKQRGLSGVYFLVSDSHGGITKAMDKHFQGATWQRCQVHLMRNLLGYSPARLKSDVAAAAKLVFQATDMIEARRRLAEFVERFGKSAPKVVACMEDGFEDAMAVMSLPEKYRKKLRTTNMPERNNEEVRRRERVIRIFPNDESALRLIGALLAERNEVWQERKYLDMAEFREWQAAQNTSASSGKVVALNS